MNSVPLPGSAVPGMRRTEDAEGTAESTPLGKGLLGDVWCSRCAGRWSSVPIPWHLPWSR